MITLDKIFVKLATDSNLWLPDFSNSIAPKDAKGKNIQDTVEGYEEYCVWLSAYLQANTFQCTNYQLEIINNLKKQKQLSNPFILAMASISGHSYCNAELQDFPEHFLDNPDLFNIQSKALKAIASNFGLKKFSRLTADENRAVNLVFQYISIQQNALYDAIEGPKWFDMGWRALLKEALNPITQPSERITFIKHYMHETFEMQLK